MFRSTDFEKIITRGFYFFLAVSAYGIYQKIFGYTFIEINWIKSGLSFADEREFISDDIRPFSTFASMPEFTFFIGMYVYYFTIKKKYTPLLFALVMLYIAGSRGVFMATMTAYFFTFIVKKYNGRYLFLSFLTSLILFVFLVFLFPILFESVETNSRMLAYGTFNGRVELLTRILEQTNLYNIFTGINLVQLEQNTFDNFYFMLIGHFGIFGAIFFVSFLFKEKIDQKRFYFLSVFLGYGFYADMIFSYYLMFLFFFASYSQSGSIVAKRLGVLSDNRTDLSDEKMLGYVK